MPELCVQEQKLVCVSKKPSLIKVREIYDCRWKWGYDVTALGDARLGLLKSISSIGVLISFICLLPSVLHGGNKKVIIRHCALINSLSSCFPHIIIWGREGKGEAKREVGNRRGRIGERKKHRKNVGGQRVHRDRSKKKKRNKKIKERKHHWGERTDTYHRNSEMMVYRILI